MDYKVRKPKEEDYDLIIPILNEKYKKIKIKEEKTLRSVLYGKIQSVYNNK